MLSWKYKWNLQQLPGQNHDKCRINRGTENERTNSSYTWFSIPAADIISNPASFSFSVFGNDKGVGRNFWKNFFTGMGPTNVICISSPQSLHSIRESGSSTTEKFPGNVVSEIYHNTRLKLDVD